MTGLESYPTTRVLDESLTRSPAYNANEFVYVP